MAPYIPTEIEIPRDPDGINSDVTSRYEKWLNRIPGLSGLIWILVTFAGMGLGIYCTETKAFMQMAVGLVVSIAGAIGFNVNEARIRRVSRKQADEQQALAVQMEREQYPYIAGADERACTTALIVLRWWIDGDILSIRFRNGEVTRTLQFPTTAVEREYGVHKAVLFRDLGYQKTGNGRAEIYGWENCVPVLFDPTFPVRYPVFDPETLQSVAEADTESDGMPVTLGSLLTHLRHLPLDQLQPWQIQAAIKQLESDTVAEPLRKHATTVATMLRELLAQNESAAIQRGLLDLKAQLNSKVAGLSALNELTQQTLENGGDPYG